jgi:ADP-ribose pyrophosphatase
MTKDATSDNTLEKFGSDDVEVISDDVVYQGFYQLRQLRLRHRLFNGGWSNTVSRELFDRHDAVGVLLYDPILKKVALVEQVRVGVIGSHSARQGNKSPWLLELVAGLIDKEELPQDVATRESVEEAGVPILKLEKIAEYYSSPGGSNEYFYLFVGKADLSQAGGVFGLKEEGEDIRVHLFGLDECWELLALGKLLNAHTIIAVQWLKLNIARLQNEWC